MKFLDLRKNGSCAARSAVAVNLILSCEQDVSLSQLFLLPERRKRICRERFRFAANPFFCLFEDPSAVVRSCPQQARRSLLQDRGDRRCRCGGTGDPSPTGADWTVGSRRRGEHCSSGPPKADICRRQIGGASSKVRHSGTGNSGATPPPALRLVPLPCEQGRFVRSVIAAAGAAGRALASRRRPLLAWAVGSRRRGGHWPPDPPFFKKQYLRHCSISPASFLYCSNQASSPPG